MVRLAVIFKSKQLSKSRDISTFRQIVESDTDLSRNKAKVLEKSKM